MSKTIVTFVMVMFLVTTVSAFDFDNVKDYEAISKTATFTNLYGIGDKIADVRLESKATYDERYDREVYLAVVGEESKFAEFTVIPNTDYSDILKDVSFYDLRTSQYITKPVIAKVKSLELVNKDIYDDVCNFELNGTLTCSRQLVGTEKVEEEVYLPIEKVDITSGKEVTIALYTEIKNGDYFDYVPKFFGQDVTEWAIVASDNQLMTYLSFDDNSGVIANNSKNLNLFNATLDNANQWNATNKKIGTSALQVRDVASQMARIKANVILTSSPTAGFTISTWAYRLQAGADNKVFGQQTGGFFMGWNSGTNQFTATYRGGGAVTAPANTTINVWELWTVTVSNTNWTIYKNGYPVATDTIATYSGSGALRIGNIDNSDTDASMFNGTLDEIAIWNRSLSSSDVLDMWNLNQKGIGYPWEEIGILNITLDQPADASMLNDQSILFNATINPIVANLTNITLYIWNSTSSIIRNFTNATTTNNTVVYNWTISGLSDGSYLWNVLAVGENGTQISNYALTNRSFTIDNTPPSLTVISPSNASNIYPYNSSLLQLGINVSVTDDNPISSIWYTSSYNSNTILLNNNIINYTNLTNTFGRQKLYVYANDSAGNEQNTTVYVDFSRIEYNNSAEIFSMQSFVLNQSYFNGLTATQVILNYNGVNYTTSLNLDGSGRTIAVSTQDIPVLGGQINFYFITILSNGAYLISPTYTQNVVQFTLDNCGTNTILVLNMSNYDQDTLTKLTGNNYNVQVRIGNEDLTQYIEYAGNFTSSTHAQVCINTTLTQEYRMDAIIQWFKNTSYFTQFYNIQNYTLSSTTLNDTIRNISLYNLIQSSGQVFNIIIKDASYLPLQGAIVQIDRQYVNLGKFLTSEIPLTDNQGTTVGHLILNNQLYNIYIWKNNQLIASFLNQQPYCNPLLTDCIINYNIAGDSSTPETVSDLLEILYYTQYDRANSTYNIIFSSRNLDNKNVRVNITSSESNTQICSNSITAISGTLSCIIPADYNGKTVIIEAYSDDEPIFVDYLRVNSVLPTANLSKARYILAGFLLPVIVLMGVTSASIALIFFVFGMILCLGIFLIDTDSLLGPSSFLVYFIFAAVLLIWKVVKGGVKNG